MPHAVLLWVSPSRCPLATQSFIFSLIGWIYLLSRACGWISWLCCVPNHHVFFITWKVHFASMRKARQSSSGLASGILIFRCPWEPTGTWSTFFSCAIWIISHPVHKPFQDTEVSKSSNETPDSVDCSEALFINDEAWLRNRCRFHIWGCQYKSQCIICHRKFFTPGVRFCCYASFLPGEPLESGVLQTHGPLFRSED